MKPIQLEDVCILLNAERTRVLELAQQGEIPGAKIGKSWIFIEEMVVESLKEIIIKQTQTRKNKNKTLNTLANEPLGADPTITGLGYQPKRRGRQKRVLQPLPTTVSSLGDSLVN